MEGTISFYKDDRGYGFIETKNHESFFFHCSNFILHIIGAQGTIEARQQTNAKILDLKAKREPILFDVKTGNDGRKIAVSLRDKNDKALSAIQLLEEQLAKKQPVVEKNEEADEDEEEDFSMEYRHTRIASVYTGRHETHAMRKARYEEEKRMFAKLGKHKGDYGEED